MQRCPLLYLSELMHLPQSLSPGCCDSFPLSAMAGLELWEPVGRADVGRLVACAGAVDSGSPWVWLAMLLVALGWPPRPRWLLVANSLRFRVCWCWLVLLLGPGAATAYLLPWSFCPMRSMPIPERPAGLFTALDGDDPEAGQCPLGVSLGQLLS